MKQRIKRKSAQNLTIRNIFLCFGIGIGLAFTLSMLLAELILSGIIPLQQKGIYAGVVWAISCLVGCWIAAKKLAERKLMVPLLCTAGFAVMAAAMHALLIPEPFIYGIPVLLGIMLGGISGTLLGAREKRRRFG